VPWEDAAFKKMLASCKDYIDRVDKLVAFSLGQEKGLSIGELILNQEGKTSKGIRS
jgi:hypothetical protein